MGIHFGDLTGTMTNKKYQFLCRCSELKHFVYCTSAEREFDPPE